MMRQSVATRLVVCALWLVSTGCRSGTPTAPTALLDGTWNGTISHSAAGNGVVVLQMRQMGASVSGTWSADYAGTAFDVAGSVGGTLMGAAASLFLAPDVPVTCGAGLSLSGTLALDAAVTGGRLTGAFTTFTCDGVDTGRVDVTRSN